MRDGRPRRKSDVIAAASHPPSPSKMSAVQVERALASVVTAFACLSLVIFVPLPATSSAVAATIGASFSPPVIVRRSSASATSVVTGLDGQQKQVERLRAGQTFQVACQGRLGPVTWWPIPQSSSPASNRAATDNSMLDGGGRRVIVTHGVEPVENGGNRNSVIYTSRLRIARLTHIDTATYICRYNGTADVQLRRDNHAAIHLYVTDLTRSDGVAPHLLASDDIYEFLQVRPGGRVIVPCRPTDPTAVEVTLVRNGVDLVATRPESVRYDPTIGFQIWPVTVGEHRGRLTCTARLRPSAADATTATASVADSTSAVYVLQVSAGPTASTTLPPPVVGFVSSGRRRAQAAQSGRSGGARDAIVGRPFTLTCSVVISDLTTTTLTEVDIEWRRITLTATTMTAATPLSPIGEARVRHLGYHDAINNNRLTVGQLSVTSVAGGQTLKRLDRNLTATEAWMSDEGVYECRFIRRRLAVDAATSIAVATTTTFVRVVQHIAPFVDVALDDVIGNRQAVDVMATAHASRLSTISSHGRPSVAASAAGAVTWRVNIDAYPSAPHVTWFGPNGRPIRDAADTAHSRVIVTSQLTTDAMFTQLRLASVGLDDAGTYRVHVTTADNASADLSFSLTVRAYPDVRASIASRRLLYDVGRNYTARCVVAAYPRPAIRWLFVPCEDLVSCAPLASAAVDLRADGPARPTASGGQFELESHVTVLASASMSGRLVCEACNMGHQCRSDAVHFYTSDVADGFGLVDVRPSSADAADSEQPLPPATADVEIVAGEATTRLTCAASVYYYVSQSLAWYRRSRRGSGRPDERIVETDGDDDGGNSAVTVVTNSTSLSHLATLIIRNATASSNSARSASGKYVCKAVKRRIASNGGSPVDDRLHHRLSAASGSGEEDDEGQLNTALIEYINVLREQYLSETDNGDSAVVGGSNDGSRRGAESTEVSEVVVSVTVLPTVSPQLVRTNLRGGVSVVDDAAAGIELYCQFAGRPRPRITWTFNNRPLTTDYPGVSSTTSTVASVDDDDQGEVQSTSYRRTDTQDESRLAIRHLDVTSEGLYGCTAASRAGQWASRQIVRLRTSLPPDDMEYINNIKERSIVGSVNPSSSSSSSAATTAPTTSAALNPDQTVASSSAASNISLPIVLAILIAALSVLIALICAKLCYSRSKVADAARRRRRHRRHQHAHPNGTAGSWATDMSSSSHSGIATMDVHVSGVGSGNSGGLRTITATANGSILAKSSVDSDAGTVAMSSSPLTTAAASSTSATRTDGCSGEGSSGRCSVQPQCDHYMTSIRAASRLAPPSLPAADDIMPPPPPPPLHVAMADLGCSSCAASACGRVHPDVTAVRSPHCRSATTTTTNHTSDGGDTASSTSTSAADDRHSSSTVDVGGSIGTHMHWHSPYAAAVTAAVHEHAPHSYVAGGVEYSQKKQQFSDACYARRRSKSPSSVSQLATVDHNHHRHRSRLQRRAGPTAPLPLPPAPPSCACCRPAYATATRSVTANGNNNNSAFVNVLNWGRTVSDGPAAVNHPVFAMRCQAATTANGYATMPHHSVAADAAEGDVSPCRRHCWQNGGGVGGGQGDNSIDALHEERAAVERQLIANFGLPAANECGGLTTTTTMLTTTSPTSSSVSTSPPQSGSVEADAVDLDLNANLTSAGVMEEQIKTLTLPTVRPVDV